MILSFLERRAAKLGCTIQRCEDDHELEKGVDYGPYFLCCAVTGYHVWAHGLPLEGIADALTCLERELQLPDEQRFDAWKNFGAGWAGPGSGT
jgi:hypothetical protein